MFLNEEKREEAVISLSFNIFIESHGLNGKTKEYYEKSYIWNSKPKIRIQYTSEKLFQIKFTFGRYPA